MRIYGKKSGRNKPGAMFARSYMYYSRQKNNKRLDLERNNIESLKIDNPFVYIVILIAAVASISVSAMLVEESAFAFIILALILFIPMVVMSFFACIVGAAIILMPYSAIKEVIEKKQRVDMLVTPGKKLLLSY